MSLMKTLARVAAGVVVARGMAGMMKQGQQGRSTRTTGGGILGDLMGQAQRGGASSGGLGGMLGGGAAGGGLGGMLGQVLGGGAQTGGAGTGRRYGGPNTRGAQGGLGGILDQLGGAQQRSGQSSQGGMGDLGGLLGGLAGGAAAGGLGGLLGGLLGGGQAQAGQTSQQGGLAQRGAQSRNDATFGEIFNDSLARQDEPEVAPTPEQNAVAGLMLKAMIQAAKSDGKIDEAEKERLLGQVGDLDEAEKQFIREQMAAPVDVQALAAEVPQGLGPQVYMMSLMAIDFDNQNEAKYLNDLAQALGISRDDVNTIHGHVGVQNLYA